MSVRSSAGVNHHGHHGIHAAGIYEVTRTTIQRLADAGDPRVSQPEYVPGWTVDDRRRWNEQDPTTRRNRELAGAMSRGETVEVSTSHARVYPELTKAPWWPLRTGRIIIDVHDVVYPVTE